MTNRFLVFSSTQFPRQVAIVTLESPEVETSLVNYSPGDREAPRKDVTKQ
jgi:hypothetical protein